MISAILLAAGQSKRMNGENKLTKEIQGIPLIKLSVKNILASSINELIIVLGHQKEIIDNAISGAERPPNFIPIGPKILSICSLENPFFFNLSHLFKWVFLLPKAPI